jgi:hypothetical protein
MGKTKSKKGPAANGRSAPMEHSDDSDEPATYDTTASNARKPPSARIPSASPEKPKADAAKSDAAGKDGDHPADSSDSEDELVPLRRAKSSGKIKRVADEICLDPEAMSFVSIQHMREAYRNTPSVNDYAPFPYRLKHLNLL